MQSQSRQPLTNSLPFWLTLGALVVGAVSATQVSGMALVLLGIVLVLLIILLFIVTRSVTPPGTSAPGGPALIDYTDKGVSVNVPWQGYLLRILRIPSAPLTETRAPDDEFSPFEILLNVVVARVDNLDALVTHYNPKLNLRMVYSQADLTRAKAHDLRYPRFGFWNGCKWVIFTEKKHELKYFPAEKPTEAIAGYATVALAEWNDPMIGKGP